MPTPTYEGVTTKQTLNRVKEPHMPFNWSINPYRGCFHGCSFCYARATHKFLDMKADDSFQNHIFIKENAVEALERQLAKLAKKYGGNTDELARRVGLVAIGTATDPYQPVEGKARLTRECLKVLAEYRIPTTITTRSPLILRDVDLLRHMPIVSVNVSVSTLNDEVCKRLEPGSSYPRKRLEMVQDLVNHGVIAGIFMAPILPCLTDAVSDMEELIRAAGQHRARFVSPSILRLTPDVKTWFFKVLKQDYPHLLPAYMNLYRKPYPNTAYVDTLMKRVNGLLEKYGFSGKSPEHRYRRKKSQSEKPLTDEQLSFSF